MDLDTIGYGAFIVTLCAFAGLVGTCGYQEHIQQMRLETACAQKTCEHGALKVSASECACLEAPR